MQGVKHDSETRRRVAELLASGAGRNEAARAVGVSPSTVTTVAREEGHDFARTMEERITQAAADLCKERRLLLLNMAGQRAEELLRTPLTPGQLRDVTISLAVLVDKRRLEMGESTSRTETIAPITLYLPVKRPAARVGDVAAIEAAATIRDEGADDDERPDDAR